MLDAQELLTKLISSSFFPCHSGLTERRTNIWFAVDSADVFVILYIAVVVSVQFFRPVIATYESVSLFFSAHKIEQTWSLADYWLLIKEIFSTNFSGPVQKVWIWNFVYEEYWMSICFCLEKYLVKKYFIARMSN